MTKRKNPLEKLGIFWTVPDKNYRPPDITKGTPKAIPETRKDVVKKILKRVKDAKGKSIRFDYSNGEFITSSLVVGPTFNSVTDRSIDLDTSYDIAHRDSKLKVWWRHGGFSD